MVLTTVVRYTNFYTDAHGQGTERDDHQSRGLGRKLFQLLSRGMPTSSKLSPSCSFPPKKWLGTS